MPNLHEYIHFDEEAYRFKICQPQYENEQIEQNIYHKRREINAAGWAIGAGFALVPITAGLSALALPVPGRAIQIAHKKLRLLEKEWSRRGHQRLPTRFIKDGIVPCAIAGAVGAIGLGVDFGFAAAGAAAVNHAAFVGGNHLAATTVQTHSPAPGTGHKFWSGVENGAHQSLVLMEHPGDAYIVPATPYDAPAYAAGQGVGMNAVHQFIDYSTRKAGVWAQYLILRRT